MDPSLYKAVISGDVVFLKTITNDALMIDLLLQKTPKDNNILHIAAEFKQIEVFKCVPVQSSMFWATNKKGNTPLHVAARVGSDEVVKFLIHHAKTQHVELGGADEESGLLVDGESYKKILRMTNLENDSALHVATRYGNIGVVILLMEAYPELSCFHDGAKESTLFIATCKGFPCIAEYILYHSPTCPSFRGTNGVTALHAAVTHKYKGIVENMMSKYPEIIKEVDLLGWTPLHYAAFIGNLEATQVLMQYNNSASYILDKSGMSALHVAAYAGRTEVVEEMIHFQPDTSDLLDSKDRTVLHTAVLGGQSNVVEYILKTPKLAGLINEADREGNTPLHLAAIYQHQEIIRILTLDVRVDRTAINKENFMVVQGTDDGDLGAVTLFQEQISLHLKNLEPPEKLKSHTPATVKKREKLQVDTNEARIFDTNALVAVLVATVTFTGALTMPGGFDSDGTPILKENIYFKLFLVFDVCSFLLSSVAIFIDYLAAAGVIVGKVHSPADLIQYSIGGMVGAFGTAMVAVLSKPQKEENNVDAIVFVTVCFAIFLFLTYKIVRKVADYYLA